MTPTETVRAAVIAMRHDDEAIRPFAARLGVPHMTLHRFLSGASVDSDTLDRLALAVRVTTEQALICAHYGLDIVKDDAARATVPAGPDLALVPPNDPRRIAERLLRAGVSPSTGDAED
jgi:hypothetical protein